jgi:hypothetical protein
MISEEGKALCEERWKYVMYDTLPNTTTILKTEGTDFIFLVKAVLDTFHYN